MSKTDGPDPLRGGPGRSDSAARPSTGTGHSDTHVAESLRADTADPATAPASESAGTSAARADGANVTGTNTGATDTDGEQADAAESAPSAEPAAAQKSAPAQDSAPAEGESADEPTPSLAQRLRERVRARRNRRVRRATVDTVAPPPSPLQPIDLTDDTAVTEVLRLAIWVGEVLMASGTSTVDTMVQVRQVAGAYGLTECDVDVTYNSIAISARRGATLPPAGSIRIVEHRSHDFTRLAAIDRLVRRIRVGAVSPQQAQETLEGINASPHPYPRWVSTVAWAGMAGSIALLLGAGPLVAFVAFACTMLIYRTNVELNKISLPYFFQQIIGGFIATVPAAALYAARDWLGMDMRPSLIIASGVVVLLSGLSLVGSVQDAITGAPITASARFFEVLMMTAGIVVGVAIGLRVAAAAGFSLPVISASLSSGDLTRLPVQVITGAFAAGFFALACYAEGRAVAVAGVAGAVGAFVYSVMSFGNSGPIIAAGTAATIVGVAGGLLARRALTPPIIVGIAGITPLLPGLSVYRSLYSFLNNEPLTGFSSLANVIGIGCSLAAGVVLGEWAARTIRRPRILNRAASLPRPIVRRADNKPDNGPEHTISKWRKARRLS